MAYDQAADDARFEADAAYDYKVEAYGDRCPGCGTLRWGGDCPRCFDDADLSHGEAFVAEPAVAPVVRRPLVPDAGNIEF